MHWCSSPQNRLRVVLHILKKKRFLNFWEVNHQKTEENNCFPSPEISPPFLSSFFEISFVTLFFNVLSVIDLQVKVTVVIGVGVRQIKDTKGH